MDRLDELMSNGWSYKACSSANPSDIQTAVNNYLDKNPVQVFTPDMQQNDPTNAAYVQNRTHWLEQLYPPIEWDVSDIARDRVDLTALNLGIAYKVSDTLITADDYLASKLCADFGRETYCESIKFAKDASEIVSGAPSGFCTYAECTLHTYVGDEDESVGEWVFVTFFVSGDYSESFGFVVPSTGVYCFANPKGIFASLVTRLSAPIYHPLDPNYLPDGTATTRYVDETVSTQIDNAIGSALGGAY